MPKIAEFYGIVILLYRRDHDPPHFHARYGEKAVFSIDPVRVMAGRLPRRANALVAEWAAQHWDELMANWHRARAHQDVRSIAPLD